jgi:glutamyl-tRNA reductase
MGAVAHAVYWTHGGEAVRAAGRRQGGRTGRRGRAWRLLMVGAGPTDLPVEGREQLERLVRAVGAHRLKRIGLSQVALLVTCNRVELYAVVVGDAAHERAVLARLTALWRSGVAGGPGATALLRQVRLRRGRAVARHLVRVAAGLESRVHGEREILGQVREAFCAAVVSGDAGPQLDRLAQGALGAARRLRRMGGGCIGPSVAQSAVWAAARRVAPADRPAVVVMGTGRVAADALAALRRVGYVRLCVCGRDPDRTARLAAATGARAVAFADREREAEAADLVITATSARRPILADPPPRRGPRLVVDLGVPRNVAPAWAAAAGAELWTVDDLGGAAGLAATAAVDGAPREASALWRRLRRRTPGRTLARLRAVAERLAAEEADRLDAVLPDLEPATRRRLRRALRHVALAAAHGPLVALAAGAPRRTTVRRPLSPLRRPEGRRVAGRALS